MLLNLLSGLNHQGRWFGEGVLCVLWTPRDVGVIVLQVSMGTTRKGWQGEKKASGQHRSVLWTDSISLNKYRRAANGLNLTSGPAWYLPAAMQGHIPLRPDRMGTSAPSVWFSKTSQLFFHLFPASYSVISLPPLYAPSLLFPLAAAAFVSSMSGSVCQRHHQQFGLAWIVGGKET